MALVPGNQTPLEKPLAGAPGCNGDQELVPGDEGHPPPQPSMGTVMGSEALLRPWLLTQGGQSTWSTVPGPHF